MDPQTIFLSGMCIFNRAILPLNHSASIMTIQEGANKTEHALKNKSEKNEP